MQTVQVSEILRHAYKKGAASIAHGPFPLLASTRRLRGRFLPDQPISGKPVR